MKIGKTRKEIYKENIINKIYIRNMTSEINVVNDVTLCAYTCIYICSSFSSYFYLNIILIHHILPNKYE